LTDSAGNVTVSYTYDSFGNLIASTGTSDNTYGFTGQQQFGEADSLVFLRARYYDPRIGRFVSRDPLLSMDYYAVKGWGLPKLSEWSKLIKPRWLNAYVYCLNNPVNLVDPTGGCSNDIPDEVLEEVIERFSGYTLPELKDACEKEKCGEGDMVSCQMCGDLNCVKKAPATIAAFHNCQRIEYSKCGAKYGKGKK